MLDSEYFAQILKHLKNKAAPAIVARPDLYTEMKILTIKTLKKTLTRAPAGAGQYITIAGLKAGYILKNKCMTVHIQQLVYFIENHLNKLIQAEWPETQLNVITVHLTVPPTVSAHLDVRLQIPEALIEYLTLTAVTSGTTAEAAIMSSLMTTGTEYLNAERTRLKEIKDYMENLLYKKLMVKLPAQIPVSFKILDFLK